jgi:hypothetical protein
MTRRNSLGLRNKKTLKQTSLKSAWADPSQFAPEFKDQGLAERAGIENRTINDTDGTRNDKDIDRLSENHRGENHNSDEFAAKRDRIARDKNSNTVMMRLNGCHITRGDQVMN